MSGWNCGLSKNADITVGEKLELSCTGATDGINKETLQIKDAQLSEETPVLSLIEVQSFDPSHLEFVVTSYRTGEHKSDQIVFFDGQNKVSVTGFDWKINSVIKQDPTNPPQPFGAYPMWKMSYPLWFWIGLVLLLVFITGVPYLQFKKIKNRKKAYDDLKNLETALGPLDAFFKSVRRMEKALEVDHVSARGFADQLDKDLRIFLSRRMQFPAHIWPEKQILKEIKKKYPKLYRDHGDDIKKYFSEFNKTKNDIQKKDCIYLMERTQKLTEIIDVTLQKRGAK